MTRYSRPADAKNPALDLSDRQAFQLDLDDGNGMTSYPRNWFELASAQEIAGRGFTAYEPPPPAPPPDPEPKDVPLTQRQLRLALFLPVSQGGMGLREAEITAMLAALPPGQKEAAVVEFGYTDRFRWDHPLVQSLRETVRTTKGMTVKQLRDAWLAAGAL